MPVPDVILAVEVLRDETDVARRITERADYLVGEDVIALQGLLDLVVAVHHPEPVRRLVPDDRSGLPHLVQALEVPERWPLWAVVDVDDRTRLLRPLLTCHLAHAHLPKSFPQYRQT